jgi:phosphodiesterase/alkaline phosphatase D-like protein
MNGSAVCHGRSSSPAARVHRGQSLDFFEKSKEVTLSETAKNPIRLNHGHQHTTFRVRIEGLKPRTTYYYRVASEESNAKSDGVKSAVHKFTTPGPGERKVAQAPGD